MAAVSVEAMVKKAIADLPEEKWTTVEASLALSLAHQMDNQVGGAAHSKEIDRLLMKLRDDAEGETGSFLDDLAARRAARRGA